MPPPLIPLRIGIQPLLIAGLFFPLQAAPSIFPAPRESRAGGAPFLLDSSVAILVPAAPSDEDLFLARILTAELSGRHQVAVSTRRVSSIPEAGRFILMGSMRNPLVSRYCSRHGMESNEAEGYVLDAGDRAVLVAGSDAAGAFYGLQSLRQLIDKRQIAGVRVRDWPHRPFRGIKLYLPGHENIAYFKRFVRDFMALYKYNKMVLEVNAAMRLDRHPELNQGWIALGRDLNYTRRDRSWGPGRQLQDSANADAGDGEVLEKDDVADLVRYANQYHIEVIPEIPTLTHSYYLLTGHRDLAEIADAEWPDTYCPSEPKVYDLVFDVLDEYIDVMKPRMVHIGHDEWRMPAGACRRCRGKSYTGLFAQDVNRIYSHLKARNVRVAMYGDHLVEAVRGVETRHVANSHGAPYDTPGALSPEQVRTLIPKEILIFNWFWDDNEKGAGERNEIALRDWGFEQVFGNFQPHIRNYDRRSGGMLGGAPSSWAATNEFNFGKDLMSDFLGCAELLWSTHRSGLRELSETIQGLMPGVRRRLDAAPLPSDSDPASSVFARSVSEVNAPFPIRQDVSSIVFVHASAKPARNVPAYEGTWNYADTADLLGWYEVAYEDGFIQTVPVRYGVNILEQGWGRGHDPRNVAYEAELVAGARGRSFFAFEWVNPRFGRPVKEIRVRSASAENAIQLEGVKVVARRAVQ